jgi:DNA-binding response OmpR family regulator
MKKILIFDEDGFCKICSAMLNDEGYQTELAFSSEEAETCVAKNGISLIVLSYPLALPFLRSESARNIPTIILSNDLNSDLIDMMKQSKNAVCLVKPLDYKRFKYIVRGVISGYLNLTGGNIIA